MSRMWQGLLPFLLIVSAVGALADGGALPRQLRAALAAHRIVLADPSGRAVVRGPLSERTQARVAAVSWSVHNACLPTPDDSAILAGAHWLPDLLTGVCLAASRARFGPAPFRLCPVYRAPPGLSAALL